MYDLCLRTRHAFSYSGRQAFSRFGCVLFRRIPALPALVLLAALLPPASTAGGLPGGLHAQESDEDAPAELNSGLLSSFRWRSIGPAVASGRLADIAIDPTDRSTWYVAASSGNVWKTTNAGTTWTPIFDDYGSYSTGAIALDPNDHLTLWVGTGENNGQRSVGYGDGVYKSVDGGRSFTNMGLETSEHIGMIAVHPDDSRTVFVAAQGPLWNAGGERGLYRTRDGGESWELVLQIDEHTGVNEVYFDPRNPDVMYASSWQRRRHQWTMIDGGPGSGIHKSTDGGETWRAINRGLPSGDKGRIGMAISPINPDVLYAIVEASGNDGGTFRSENMGENWSRTSRYQSTAPMYYHELYADPHRFDRIYAMDTFLEMSDDGGETWSRLPTQSVHVDHHAIAFDPDDPEHLILGNDGGLYETFDFGENWSHFTNLPLTQYYKVATSNDEPFYYVYGGTQDNNTMGGPSQTLGGGIRNSDWYVTLGGDGFDPVIDPENPDIIYSQLQHGVLSRFDRGSKERLDIQPQADPGGPPLRWYWDAGLIMSPHDNHRLYFGAQTLFRSDDQGSSWRAISGDLSRNLDRNQLEVMGRVWSVDAVGKNRSTSVFGHIVAISESPLVEGLIYVGTDDGLVQVTEDGGETWREIASLPGVPDTSFVHDVEASLHDPDAVFAVVNNFKRGDYRPYVLKSEDRGRSWTAITGGLPDNSPSFSIVQDHIEPDLLFLGAEFGAFVSVDGGESWMEFDSGLPTIAVRDLEIQQREGDLVAATFGRSFYVIDDYTPLRELARGPEPILASAGHLFEVADGDMYVPWNPGGANGADFYAADNPELGVTFTYWVGETLRTRRAERQAEERRAAGRGEDTPYPSWEELMEEDREEAPRVYLTVRDKGGQVVNVVNGSTSRGVHRAVWNYRYPAYTPVTGGGGGGGFGGFGGGNGPMALPGSYTVSLAQRVDGEVKELAGPAPFEIAPLTKPAIAAQDRAVVLAFQRETGELLRAVTGSQRAAAGAAQRIGAVKQALEGWPAAPAALMGDARALELRLLDLREALDGSRTRTSRAEPDLPGIAGRVNQVVRGHWNGTHGPTGTHREQYRVANEAFSAVYPELQQLVETDLPALEERLEEAGVPWTTGRALPSWPPGG
ncbi:MAG: glycosyl hydrolase [Gammaproteobacteria bacterium]|nr:glycosyl hydrolase [Gammaproteobacteria bacterium]